MMVGNKVAVVELCCGRCAYVVGRLMDPVAAERLARRWNSRQRPEDGGPRHPLGESLGCPRCEGTLVLRRRPWPAGRQAS